MLRIISCWHSTCLCEFVVIAFFVAVVVVIVVVEAVVHVNGDVDVVVIHVGVDSEMAEASVYRMSEFEFLCFEKSPPSPINKISPFYSSEIGHCRSLI